MPKSPKIQGTTPLASRRQILGAMGLTLACPFVTSAPARAGPTPATTGHVTDAPLLDHARLEDHIPWTGRHQAGITSPRPAHGMIASFDVVADDLSALDDLFTRLSARISFLTRGGEVPLLDPRLPPADSGLLGPMVYPDALTITVSVGESLFETRPWLRVLKPKQLSRMRKFANDALDRNLCHGQLALQICANSQDKTLHALRDILRALPDRLVLKWKQEGSVPVIRTVSGEASESARNFLGFRDGSANPDATNAELMERLVWTGLAGGEPAWAEGGSYQVVRIIRNFVERWDRTPLGEQERIIGRRKMTGAPLDQPEAPETALPDYGKDPQGEKTALDAHIRLANPRDAKSLAHQMLRRPFNYSNSVTKSGQLDQGLLFISYQADLEEGFIAVQRRLDGEPLEEYIKPVGGGYFYVLPGVDSPSDYLGSSLVAAVRALAPQNL